MPSQVPDTPLILEAKDLHQRLQTGGGKLVILDGTFVLPTEEKNPHDAFMAGRIPGARFFNIDAFSDTTSPLPHMLCSAEEFAARIGAMGIGNDDHVVIYGQSGIIMGPPRVWWTFKIFGHERLSVLNGGLPAWIAEGLSLESGAPPLPPGKTYMPKFRPELVVSQRRVQNSLRRAEILDARPLQRFLGTAPEPRPGMRSGHIPGSRSVPASSLVDDKGRLLGEKELRALLCPPATPKEILLTCGSGVTACALGLALETLGVQNWAVYDGSWAEWGQENSGTEVIKN